MNNSKCVLEMIRSRSAERVAQVARKPIMNSNIEPDRRRGRRTAGGRTRPDVDADGEGTATATETETDKPARVPATATTDETTAADTTVKE
jgi:hypothetical protein